MIIKRLLHSFCHTRSALSGFILCAVARQKTPHPDALEKTGIRVVGLGSRCGESVSAQEEVWSALSLLERHAVPQFHRIVKYIRIIIIGRIVKGGAYIPRGKVCVLNLDSIPASCSKQDRVVVIAALLAHEATHGLLNHKRIPCVGNTAIAIERICEAEQTRVLERLGLRAVT
jgi:hypothetical protein